MGPASFGPCVVWVLRRMGPARFKSCAVCRDRGMTIRRIGCVGDVHGALGSLRRVLDYLRTVDVEGVLLTGDFGRGPWNADPALGNTGTPAEILELVTSSFANVLLVPGNHDDPGLGAGVSVDRREISWLQW